MFERLSLKHIKEIFFFEGESPTLRQEEQIKEYSQKLGDENFKRIL